MTTTDLRRPAIAVRRRQHIEYSTTRSRANVWHATESFRVRQ